MRSVHSKVEILQVLQKKGRILGENGGYDLVYDFIADVVINETVYKSGFFKRFISYPPYEEEEKEIDLRLFYGVKSYPTHDAVLTFSEGWFTEEGGRSLAPQETPYLELETNIPSVAIGQRYTVSLGEALDYSRRLLVLNDQQSWTLVGVEQQKEGIFR